MNRDEMLCKLGHIAHHHINDKSGAIYIEDVIQFATRLDEKSLKLLSEIFAERVLSNEQFSANLAILSGLGNRMKFGDRVEIICDAIGFKLLDYYEANKQMQPEERIKLLSTLATLHFKPALNQIIEELDKSSYEASPWSEMLLSKLCHIDSREFLIRASHFFTTGLSGNPPNKFVENMIPGFLLNSLDEGKEKGIRIIGDLVKQTLQANEHAGQRLKQGLKHFVTSKEFSRGDDIRVEILRIVNLQQS